MASPPPTPLVQQISKCTVKPAHRPRPQHSDAAATAVKNLPLSVWDLAMLSTHYVQKGHLFSNLSSTPLIPSVDHLLHKLKSSLSLALVHFYPLAGRLATERSPDGSGHLHVSIDCSDDRRHGAEFIHASANDITVAQVLATSQDVPSFVQDFFPYNLAPSYDGHSIPLLAVQLTELADGVFLALCFNHVVGDGTSFWHFFNSWAEIARSGELSRPPVLDRWFIEGEAPPIKLPFSDPSEFIERFAPPPLRERMFHFSSHSIAKLKAKANEECAAVGNTITMISSFQALSSLVWRSITRARRMPMDQPTSCWLAIQNRTRLQPPLSPCYFGNSLDAVVATTTGGELLHHKLGWAAALLHEAVRSHTNEAIRGFVRKYHEKPMVYPLSMFDGNSVMMGSSPRFDMYGCDFGWGKAVALRSGAANKLDGKVSSYPGREGAGSVDLEVCLLPEYMAALLMDEEFMSAVSTSWKCHFLTRKELEEKYHFFFF